MAVQGRGKAPEQIPPDDFIGVPEEQLRQELEKVMPGEADVAIDSLKLLRYLREQSDQLVSQEPQPPRPPHLYL